MHCQHFTKIKNANKEMQNLQYMCLPVYMREIEGLHAWVILRKNRDRVKKQCDSRKIEEEKLTNETNIMSPWKLRDALLPCNSFLWELPAMLEN
eukprot:m.95483 g.95483  ORF g.95483 m.95483 type:complete len:94 (-) comp13494_c0_seq2:70-351(-)